jgi:hypothetical protein
MSLNCLPLAALLASSLVFSAVGWSQEKPDNKDADSQLGDYVIFPEIGIKLRQPKGYEKPKSFIGFGNEATKCSILCTKLPAPFAEVSKGFTKANLAARGWKLHSRADVKIDGQPAVLINFEQPAGGQVFEKWAIIFGDEKRTLLVTATYPQSAKKEAESALKAAILSTRRDDSPADAASDALPFTIETSNKLKPAESISRVLMYNLDGEIPSKSAKDPLLVVAPSIGDVTTITDRKAFAERQLRATAHTKDLEIRDTKKIEIDELESYESHGTAKDTKSGEPLQVYQVILFDKDLYIRVIGLVGTDKAKEFVPEFKSMALSIKRKKDE